jgi:glycosyltransferase involved in cell wall biosynthesis
VADQLDDLRRIAIVPALNEEQTVGRVIDEIRDFDPGFDVVVVDDGSVDRTAGVAVDRGAYVLRLPFNLGIGGAVQTGFVFARDAAYDLMVQVDGDGQHDPGELGKLTEAMEPGVDMVCGSRFLVKGEYLAPVSRRAGIHVFAWLLSRLVGQQVTDPTSGFRMTNRRGIELFARDYPHDYPEVEAILMMHAHRLRLHEVHVSMNARGYGRSSIDYPRSAYYMVKVLLAIFIGLFRRRPTAEEARGKDEILGGPPMDTGELKAITGGDE